MGVRITVKEPKWWRKGKSSLWALGFEPGAGLPNN